MAPGPRAIGAEAVTAAQIGLGQPILDHDTAYWLEARPEEGGRSVLVRRRPGGAREDLTPPPFNVRTRVHEYGGGAYAARDGVVVAVDFADQRVYRIEQGRGARRSRRRAAAACATPISRSTPPRARSWRCARTTAAAARRSTASSGSTSAAATMRARCWPAATTSSARPASAPTAASSPGCPGTTPTCPGTRPSCGSRRSARVARSARPAGSRAASGSRSCSRNGRRTGSSTSSRTAPAGGTSTATATAAPCPSARCPPNLPGRPGVSADDGTPFSTATLLACFSADGLWHLARIDVASGGRQRSISGYTELAGVSAARGRALLRAGAADRPAAILLLEPASGAVEVLGTSGALPVDPAWLAAPRAIAFPSGPDGDAYAFYYPPTNPDFQAPPGERPPLIVKSHGGPTGSTSSELRLRPSSGRRAASRCATSTTAAAPATAAPIASG